MFPEETLINRYSLQIAIYALAAQRLLNFSIGQCLVYSTFLGKEVEVSNEILEKALEGVIKY